MPAPQRPLRFVSSGHIHPLWWAPIGIALGVTDYLTGHVVVPPVYVPVVTVAAWYSGTRVGFLLSTLLPLARLLTADQLDTTVTPVRVFFGMLTLVIVAFIAGRLGQHERDLTKRVRALESLLPMCMWCKSIRTGEQWERLETYMESAGTPLTHGICPSCTREHYPEEAGLIQAPPATVQRRR